MRTVAGLPSVAKLHLCVATDRLHACQLTWCLALELVYVHRAIAALRSDEFTEWVPRNALNVVVVLRDLANHGACAERAVGRVSLASFTMPFFLLPPRLLRTISSVQDARDKVGAANDKGVAAGRPCHVVDLGRGRTRHCAEPPMLLGEICISVVVEGCAKRGRRAVRGYPEKNHAVVTRRRQQLALGAEAHAIDDARMAF